ncbi:MAG: NAD(P)/FAD-dependent oxidoreductase, partial [Bdellovibrionales bacterium]|nr:NAD(P)/FAD-dependent oxidoreductase [Bdellovibrionales bacterium]
MGQPSARKLVIIGGGAAGFFAALAAAERALRAQAPVDISILESSDSLLKKVKISGGGRCNVTHNCFDVMKFCENYPRGKKELISLMQRFQAQDTVEWFAKRGVKLVAEEDGRMFPDTDTSQTIIDCFLNEAERLNVKIFKNHTVESIEVLSSGSRFCVKVKDRSEFLADSILVATGSSPAGYRIAKDLG